MRLRPTWRESNFRVKLGMLILATLLWFLVVTEKAFEYSFAIPLTTVGLHPCKCLAFALPSTVRVKFHGRGKELLRLLYVNHPHLQLDLGSVTPASSPPSVEGGVAAETARLALRTEMVVIPGGLSVVPIGLIEPDSVLVTLDPLKSGVLPVRARLDLDIAPGYTILGEPEITPATVKLSGPEGALRGVNQLHTAPTALRDLRRTTEVTVGIEPPAGYGVTVTPPLVKVILRIEKLGEREIAQVSVEAVNRPPNRTTSLEPSVVKLELSGPVSLLAKLEAEDFLAWVDCREEDAARPGWRLVQVTPPAGVEVARVMPSSVRVLFRK